MNPTETTYIPQQTAPIETKLNIIYFSVIDNRLGTKNEHQDEKLLFHYSTIPFEELVISITRVMSYLQLIDSFGKQVKTLRTQKTVTYINKIKNNIYSILKVGYVEDYYDRYILQYISQTNKLFHIIHGDIFLYNIDFIVQPEMKEMRQELFRKIEMFYLQRIF